MNEREQLIRGFVDASGWVSASIEPIPGDASFRRYFRVVERERRAPGRGREAGPAVALINRAKLEPMQRRCRALVAGTPPDGAAFLRLATKILQRDGNWADWKVQKCQPQERTAKDDPEEEDDPEAPEPTAPGGATREMFWDGPPQRHKPLPWGGMSRPSGLPALTQG